MKITKNQLKQIIQEELATSLNESIPPPERTISSEPTEVVPPPSPEDDDEYVRTSELGKVSIGTGERTGGPNPYSLGSAYGGKRRPVLKPPTDLPGGVRLGATETVFDSDMGSLEVGGSIKTGPYKNVNDFLSNIQVGGKGKLNLAQGLDAYGTVDYSIDPNSKSGRENFGSIQTALGGGITLNNMLDLGIAKRVGVGEGGIESRGATSGRIGFNLPMAQLYAHIVQSDKGGGEFDSSVGATIDVPTAARIAGNFLKRLKGGKKSTAIPAHLRPKDDSGVAYKDVPAAKAEPSDTDKIRNMSDKDWKNLLKSGDLTKKEIARYRAEREAHHEGSGAGDVVNETFKRWKVLIND
jgi:hypothetical protein